MLSLYIKRKKWDFCLVYSIHFTLRWGETVPLSLPCKLDVVDTIPGKLHLFKSEQKGTGLCTP